MYRKLFFTLSLLSLALLAGCTDANEAAASPIEPQALGASKLVHYGWGQSYARPSKKRLSLERLNSGPFDGVTFKHSGARELFTKRPLSTAAFDKDLADFKTLETDKLGDSFLRVQVFTQPGWDWTSDSDWAATESNLLNYVRLAKRAGLKGLVFDPEPYGFNPWNYKTQPARDSQSFAQVEAAARRRGASFMRMVEREYPGMTLLSLKIFGSRSFFLSDNPSPLVLRQRVENDSILGLWIGFVNGMVSELDGNITLVDGNQQAYHYFSTADFDEGFDNIYGELASSFIDSNQNVSKFREHVEVANAVFADGVLNLHGTPRYTGYYYRNNNERRKQLEHNIYHSMRTSQDFTWVYTETARWWNGAAPAGFDTLVARAKRKSTAGRALGFGTGFVENARGAYEARARIGGEITPNVPGVKFEVTGAPDFACKAINNGGKYGCHLPPGITVTIKPVAPGVSFTPASRTYPNISQDNLPPQSSKQNFGSR